MVAVDLNLKTVLGGSRRGGGGAFSGKHILKYPARLMLKYVCILKSYICVKNYILIVSHKNPLYLMYNNRTVSILSTNYAVCSSGERLASHDNIFYCRGSKHFGRLYFCSGPYLILPTIEWQIQQLCQHDFIFRISR